MAQEDRTCVERIADWIGVRLDTQQIDQLDRYAGWLSDEGLALGGIGPNEAMRLWERHICDSLAFGRDMAGVGSLVDVGSGVGLPGVPLAVAFPDTAVTLVERSGRRADALRRVSAILGLRIDVVEGEIATWRGSTARATFRASLPVTQAASVAAHILEPGGEAWFGLGRGPEPQALLSHRSMVESIRSGLDVEEVWVPPEILDSGVWLLRMTLL